jgi:hypothetical protein
MIDPEFLDIKEIVNMLKNEYDCLSLRMNSLERKIDDTSRTIIILNRLMGDMMGQLKDIQLSSYEIGEKLRSLHKPLC